MLYHFATKQLKELFPHVLFLQKARTDIIIKKHDVVYLTVVVRHGWALYGQTLVCLCHETRS